MKKSLSLILALVLVASMISFAAAEDQAVDLGGVTITFGNWGDMPADLQDPNSLESLWRAELEAKYNFKFAYDYRPGQEGTPTIFLSSVLAGEPFADVVNMMSDAITSFALQGLLYPLNTLTSYDLVNGAGVNKTVADSLTLADGNTYGVFFSGNYVYDNQIFVAYNKSLAEREGLPDLAELYKNGEWTWDKFIELASQVHKDTNGDGVIDQYGFCYDPSGYGLSFLVSTGVSSISKDLKVNYNDPAILDAMRAMQKSMAYSIKAPSDANWDWYLTRLKGGDVLFAMSQYLWSMWNYRDMTDDYGFLPFPSPDGETYYTYINSFNCQAIPYNCKHPEAAAFVMGLLQQTRPWEVDENGELLYDKNNVADFVLHNWEEDFRDEEAPEYFEFMFTQMPLVFDRQRDYNVFWSGFMNFATNIQDGSMTPEQAAEAYVPTVQAALDQFFAGQ
jgi:multiple sugar transport system substrate-binding protein